MISKLKILVDLDTNITSKHLRVLQTKGLCILVLKKILLWKY